MKTGLIDKNGIPIMVGDKTKLVLPSGETRTFDVCYKTVNRVVKSHPDFDQEFAHVAITGIVFMWRGYELFPCIDLNGESDVSKMEVIKSEPSKSKISNLHSNALKTSELATFITGMIMAERKSIIECLENNDPDTLHEVIFEYALSCGYEDALEEE